MLFNLLFDRLNIWSSSSLSLDALPELNHANELCCTQHAMGGKQGEHVLHRNIVLQQGLGEKEEEERED